MGVLVEVNCETDFVARNEMFRAFADEVAKAYAAERNAELRGRAGQRRGAKIGENIQIPRHARMEVSGNGLVAAYIHTGAKVGVLVEVGAGKEGTVASDEFKQLVKDITLQIAAGHPYAVSRDQVPAEVVAKEREIAAQSERLKGKPAAGHRAKSSRASWRSSTSPTAWWTRASSRGTPRSPSRSMWPLSPSSWATR